MQRFTGMLIAVMCTIAAAMVLVGYDLPNQHGVEGLTLLACSYMIRLLLRKEPNQ